MKKQRYSLFLISGIVCSALQAQLPVFRTLPFEKESNSIIRNSETNLELVSELVANEKQTLIVSVQNKEGREAASFACFCDQFSQLKQFSGELYNANGVLLQKFKKSDLTRTEFFEGLASDNYTYFLNIPEHIRPPFTVKYTWEVKYQDGLVGLPGFFPQTKYSQSVDTATYRLTVPAKGFFKYKAINSSIVPTESEGKKGGYTYTFATGSLAPIESEPYGLSLWAQIPHIFVTPIAFQMSGKRGSMENWNTFGRWQNRLLEQRDILPEKAKQKVHELTGNCQTDREKVKVLYDYLGKTTRYVSIQLGIGGLQPFMAQDVFSTGFGDCKGLSNYLKALLQEAGIPSTYTEISTNRARLLSDFASANQMNHVILQVPLPNDTLWLECTNPQIPFGYVHSQIADHDALLITPEGGVIKRLPQYSDSLNTENFNAKITLKETGEAVASVTRTSRVLQHEMQAFITKLNETKQKDGLRREIKLPNARITTLDIKDIKEATPELRVTYSAELGYGTKTGNRLFIPVNVFRNGFREVSNRKPRKQPIYLSKGYIDCDTISIQLPEKHTVESLPKNTEINSDFGHFRTNVTTLNNEIVIIQSLHIRKGVYPIDKFGDFCAFTDLITKSYENKIVLKKEP